MNNKVVWLQTILQLYWYEDSLVVFQAVIILRDTTIDVF